MTKGSETRRAISGAVAGLLYGCVLAFLSLAAVGAGHGTGIALFQSSAPLGIFFLVANHGDRDIALYIMLFGTPLLWAMLGCLAVAAGGAARSATVLLLLHYLSGLAMVVAHGEGIRGIGGHIPEGFVIWVPVYLIGQAELWWRMRPRCQLRPTA